jgi:hypothetical protein
VPSNELVLPQGEEESWVFPCHTEMALVSHFTSELSVGPRTASGKLQQSLGPSAAAILSLGVEDLEGKCTLET